MNGLVGRPRMEGFLYVDSSGALGAERPVASAATTIRSNGCFGRISSTAKPMQSGSGECFRVSCVP